MLILYAVTIQKAKKCPGKLTGHKYITKDAQESARRDRGERADRFILHHKFAVAHTSAALLAQA